MCAYARAQVGFSGIPVEAIPRVFRLTSEEERDAEARGASATNWNAYMIEHNLHGARPIHTQLHDKLSDADGRQLALDRRSTVLRDTAMHSKGLTVQCLKELERVHDMLMTERAVGVAGPR